MTSTADIDDSADPTWRRGLYVLAASTVVRLVMAALVPLVNDEAYYWEWSQRLSVGYFDHPPAIAWLMAIGPRLEVGVRLGAVLAGTLSGYALMRAARRLGGDHAGFWAALIFSCLPLAAAGYVLATPDAPLFLGLTWTLYAVIEALSAERGSRQSLGWWTLAGVAIGVAMLSKYTAVLIPAAIAISCVLYAPLRPRLREAGPWVAVVVASLVLAPNLWWNATHGWASFVFQLGHGLGAPKTVGVAALMKRELNLVGGQAGLVSPILFVLLAGAVWRALRARGDAVLQMLGTVSVFVLAFFVFSATRKNVEANWPAAAWLPAMMLLAVEAARGERAAWLRRGLWLGGVLIVVVYVDAATLMAPRLGLRPKRDPVSQAYGWDGVARDVETAVRTAQTVRRGDGTAGHVWVAGDRYQDAAQLSWSLARRGLDTLGVFSLNIGGRPNQYDLWPGFRDRAARGDALVLVLDEGTGAEPRAIVQLAPFFNRIDEGPPVVRSAHDLTLNRQRSWILREWNGGWPGHSTPSIPGSQ